MFSLFSVKTNKLAIIEKSKKPDRRIEALFAVERRR
jgi:hypothetical protein